MLFGTKAAIKPKFGEQPFGPMDSTFSNMLYGVFNYLPTQPVEGFGVSIPQLLEVIERDEF